jgi:UDP-N-acetylglucosamine 3-dehydrogenase
MTRIAILGAGTMGRTHAAAFAALPEVEVVGPLPRDADFTAVLGDSSVDAVDVCVPTQAHRDFVVAALERGKHVFCETPLALTLDDARAMKAAAQRAGKLLQVGLLMRSVAAYRHVKEVAASGVHGRLVSLTTWRLSSYLRPEVPDRKSHYGDPTTELMTFDFDFALWLMGRPAQLTASGKGDVTALLEWDDGRRATIMASGLMPVGTSFAAGFRALFEGAAFELETVFEGKGPPRSRFSVPVQDANPYEVELRHFVDCIRGRADPELMDAQRAIEALELSLATQRALAAKPLWHAAFSPS